MATMLDCKKVQPKISEYIDGAVGGDEAWGVKLHLSSCAVCSRIESDLRSTTSLLSALPTLEPSANFEAMLALRLADQALRPSRPTLANAWSRFSEWWSVPRLSPALATSAVALAAVIPAAFFVSAQHGGAHTPVASATTTPVVLQQTASASDPALDEMWREHSSYAASEPLADPAGMLQARSAPSTSTAASPDISL